MENKFFKIANYLLIIMFLIILISSTILLLTAVININYTSKRITSIVAEAVEQIISMNKINQQVAQQNLDEYLDHLKAQSKIGIESSTISFLFQIFSISLITIGVYLLKEYRKETIKIKKMSEKIQLKIGKLNPLILSLITGSKIERYLSLAIQSILIAQDASSQQQNKLLIQFRDWINFALLETQNIANNENIGIESEQYKHIKDWVELIESYIREPNENIKYDDILKKRISELKKIYSDDKMSRKYGKILSDSLK